MNKKDSIVWLCAEPSNEAVRRSYMHPQVQMDRHWLCEQYKIVIIMKSDRSVVSPVVYLFLVDFNMHAQLRACSHTIRDLLILIKSGLLGRV